MALKRSRPSRMVIGPLDLSLLYPVQPPSRAIVQAAHARLSGSKGFCCGAPLHCLLKRMENPDLLVVEHAIGQRPLAASFPHEHELHRDSRRDESDYGQFFESFAVLDDTFLDAQPLAFKRPKQLFDVPALPIPADHRKRLGNGFDFMRGQQPPHDLLFAGRRIKLARLDGEEFDLFRSVRIGAVYGPTDANPSEADRHPSQPRRALARPLGDLEQIPVRLDHSIHCFEQSATPSQHAIAASARQQVSTVVWQAIQLFVDVAFPIVEDGDHGSFGQHGFGLVAALEPAIGFFLLDGKLLVVLGFALRPTPDLRVHQTETLLRLRIHGYYRMHEQSGVGAVSNLAEPVLASALGLVVDLAGILNRQHMPPRCGSGHEHRPRRDHFLDGDRIVLEKAPKLHLLSSVVREVEQTDCFPPNYPLHYQLAVPLRPGIAKISNPQLHRRPPCAIRDGRNRITPDSLGSNRIALQHRNRGATWPESQCNMCAQASRVAGTVPARPP